MVVLLNQGKYNFSLFAVHRPRLIVATTYSLLNFLLCTQLVNLRAFIEVSFILKTVARLLYI